MSTTIIRKPARTKANQPASSRVARIAGKSSGKRLAARSSGFVDLYSAQPTERIDLIRGGVPASFVVDISKAMGVTKEALFNTLRLSRATIDRKIANNESLPPDQGERVIGMAKLVGQVQVMVEQSGEPQGFDAARWVAQWLEQPSPALGGERPSTYMDTLEGQEMVSSLLARMQSGAYA